MNLQLFAWNFALSVVPVAVIAYGGWGQGKGGSWPLVLAVSMTAGAQFGLCTRCVPEEAWRKPT